MADRKKATNQADRRIGQRIRLQRMALRMSQDALAAALGLTFQQIQKYEKGVSRVSASRLEDIAQALKVPVAFFYDESGETQGAANSAMALLATPQGIRLLQAFEAIGSPSLQRKTMELVEVVAAMRE